MLSFATMSKIEIQVPDSHGRIPNEIALSKDLEDMIWKQQKNIDAGIFY